MTTISVERERRLPELIWLSDVRTAADTAYLVKGLLGSKTLAVIYGESNSGKTFFALDLALHVAQGRAWRDIRTTNGLVIYVAGEGAHSVLNRLSAYMQHVAPEASGAPLAVLPTAVDFLMASEIDELTGAIQQAEHQAGETAALIVVDTLARSMAGGSENDAGDMGNLVRAADELRQKFGATVLFIHHSGKDATRGARGHSSLRAAIDTEIEVTGLEGVRVARVTKQRDFPVGEAYAFELVTVALGMDQDGDPITSCVVRPADVPATVTGGPGQRGLGQSDRQALDTLREAIKAHGEHPPTEIFKRNTMGSGIKVVQESHWREIFKRRRSSPTDTPDAVRKAFSRSRNKLQAVGRIQADDGYFWLLQPHGQIGQNGTCQDMSAGPSEPGDRTGQDNPLKGVSGVRSGGGTTGQETLTTLE